MRERDVYEIWSRDNSAVYVGLSVSAKKRAGQHRYNKTAGGLLDNGGKMRVVRSSVPEPDAVSLERELIAKYRATTGVKCLNRRAGGQLGSDGGLRWTKDVVREIARGCKTRSEFYYKNGSAYQAARRDGYFEELCAEFGFAESIHSVAGSRRLTLKERWDNCTTIFDLTENDRRVLIGRGLLREFANIDVVRASSIPHDIGKRTKYLPYSQNHAAKGWKPDLKSYEYSASRKVGALIYHGQLLDVMTKMRKDCAKEFCEYLQIPFVDDEDETTPRYPTEYIRLQKDFPIGYATMNLLSKFPERYLRNFWLMDRSYKSYGFVQRNNDPIIIEKAISDGSLPIPSHYHDTGALFPIKSVVQWALDTTV